MKPGRNYGGEMPAFCNVKINTGIK